VFREVSAPPRLYSVTFEARGRVTSVLGPNGSGKTSVLLVASGLLEPSGGSVVRPRRVGAAWQNPYLSFHRPTVAEELEDAAGSRGEAMRLLREHGLAHAAGRSPFTLSLGEARMLSILRAFAWGPEAVVLDEPTAGLDVRGKAAVAGLIEGSRLPALIATHDPLFALAVSEWSVSLRRGRSVYEGPPEGSPEAEAARRAGVGRCEARCLLGLR
jgi:ABC-type multidrug transport system ATPase subunit